MRKFVVALTFLTIIPVGSRFFQKPIQLSDGAPSFPLVGALLGFIFGGLVLVGGHILPQGPLVALAFMVSFIITRGLHIDGLADTADGAVGGMKREKAFSIMRSGDVGPVGMFAVIVVYLFKYASLVGLQASLLPLAFFGMFFAGRWNMVLVGSAFSSARGDGLGSQFIGGLTVKHLLSALLNGLVVLGLFFWWRPELLPVLASGMVVALFSGWLLAYFVARHLGGLTGDVLGAINEVSEAGFLLGILLCVGLF